MKQDEIIEMARQAGFWKDLFAYPEFKEHLESFAKLVAAKEREACVIAGFHACLSQDDAVRVREAIRARGEA